MHFGESAHIIIRKAAITIAVVSLFVLCLEVNAHGKEVSGEIGSISKRSISIIYGRDAGTGAEHEMLLPINDDIQYNHIESLADLSVGDRISISFDEESETFGDMQRTKKRIRAISFISPAPPKVPDPDEEEYMLLKKGYKR